MAIDPTGFCSAPPALAEKKQDSSKIRKPLEGRVWFTSVCQHLAKGRLGQQRCSEPSQEARASAVDTRALSVPHTASPSGSPDSISDFTWILTEKALTDSVDATPPTLPLFPNFREQRWPETVHWEAKARQTLSWRKHGATVIQTRSRFVDAEMWRGRGGPSVAVRRAISAASPHRASIYPLPRASFSPGWGLAHAAAGVGEGNRQGAQELGVREKGWELEALGPRQTTKNGQTWWCQAQRLRLFFPLQMGEGRTSLAQRVTCHHWVH